MELQIYLDNRHKLLFMVGALVDILLKMDSEPTSLRKTADFCKQ